MIVTLSHRGYIKRTPATEFRVQGRGGKGLKGMETKATEERRGRRFRRASVQCPGSRLPAVLHEHRARVCAARV
ncbi:MAG: DNA gyrase C-terminal beta-propeller domain-containing protein [Luteolibacter sp.]